MLYKSLCTFFIFFYETNEVAGKVSTSNQIRGAGFRVENTCPKILSRYRASTRAE